MKFFWIISAVHTCANIKSLSKIILFPQGVEEQLITSTTIYMMSKLTTKVVSSFNFVKKKDFFFL